MNVIFKGILQNIHQRIRKIFSFFTFSFLALVVFVGLFSLTACDKAGIQGGDLKDKFNGVETVKAISPTSIELQWTLDPRYSSYNIYKQGQSVAVKSETFSKTQVNSLTPNTLYSFTVTGVAVDSSQEEGFSVSGSATTLSNFTGIKTENLSVINSGRVDIKFVPQSDDVTYEVYKIIQGGTWSFSSAADKQLGSYVKDNGLSVTGLSGGVTYCFYVLAKYTDNTSEPTTTDTTYINANSACVTTTNNMPSLPEVTMNDIIPGKYPWFDIEKGLSTYTTEIYDASNNQLLATKVGSGQVRSSIAITPGEKSFYAIVKSSTEQAKKEILTTPFPQTGDTKPEKRIKPFFRSLESSGAHGPVYPQVIGGGKGVQKLGQQVVTGDFNCDGLPDLAVSAPDATPIVDPKHRTKMGAITVYYSYRPKVNNNGIITDGDPILKTDIAPSESAVFPNAQLIYYPYPTNYSTTAPSMQIGTKMAVGNVNGDCTYIDPATKAVTTAKCDTLYSNTSLSPNDIFTCDDLAVSTNLSHGELSKGSGSVYVLFGNSSYGINSGSGTTNFGSDEFTCDAFNFTCLPVELLAPSGVTNFGRSIVFGDFNNDGYDDLAISAINGSNSEVYVLRGTASGLYTASDATGNSFPKIARSAATTALFKPDDTKFIKSNDAGFSLGVAYDSRYCKNTSRPGYDSGSGTFTSQNYDFSKCDDLVIGAPKANRIFSCAGIMSTGISAVDITTNPAITKWVCEETYPAGVGASDQYGYSILGVRNQNAYPTGSTNIGNGSAANLAGAVFVGAPGATVSGNANAGKVYGYYITPKVANYKSAVGDTQGIGGFQLLTTGCALGGCASITGHSIGADNQVACNVGNNDVDPNAQTFYSSIKGTDTASMSTGTFPHCNNQMIYPNPSSAGAKFGMSLGTVADIKDPFSKNGFPYLAVGAPEKSVLNSIGNSYIDKSGVVYLFKLDISNLATSTITNHPNISNTGVNYFAGGISPYGPTIFYPLDLTKNSYFGLGGIVGGEFGGGSASINSGDVIAAAESFSYNNIPDNGSVYIYNSTGGTFNPQMNTAGSQLNLNISKEIDYHFEMAKVVGDINHDGFEDVVATISTGSSVQVILYYGSTQGLITSPAPSKTAVGTNPLIISTSIDPGMGKMFYRIGSVNGDAYDDLLLIGDKGAYLYYGSFSGLVASAEPALAPIGSNPLMFGTVGTWNLLYTSIINNKSNDESRQGNFLSNSYDSSNEGVVAEDFNADGYVDLAFGLKDSSNANKVIIVYGSSNGPQVNRTTGALNTLVTSSACSTTCNTLDVPLNPAALTALQTVNAIASIPKSTGGNYPTLVISGNSAPATYTGAYINLYSGASSGLNTIPYQYAIPAKKITSAGDIDGDGVKDLLIYNSDGRVAVYKGKQAGANYDIYTTAYSLSNTTGYQDIALVPSIATTVKYGVGIASARDFNGDGYDDILINVPAGDYDQETHQASPGYLIVVFGGPTGIRDYTSTAPTITPMCFGYTGTVSKCEPYQVYLPDRTENEYTYISRSAVGDINGDGIPDILIGGYGRNHPSGLAFATGVLYVLY